MDWLCVIFYLKIWRDNLDWQPIGIHVVPKKDDYVSYIHKEPLANVVQAPALNLIRLYEFHNF